MFKKLICWIIGHDYWRKDGIGRFVCRRCGAEFMKRRSEYLKLANKAVKK